MALIKCSECSTDVSDSALKCPKCGVQLREATRTVFGKIIKWLFVIFNIFMAFIMVMWYFFVRSGDANIPINGKEGEAIYTGLGAMMLVPMWGFGALILGLFVIFTRPKL